ncbi:DUF397 domain-containing protein [Streptomyces sp. Q6]|uniref:DUF397 domain-containing protein n=1 Tax=Streptomyces citrinus TaxID=3118173 RepID=A0ACD5AEA5_9ACTN
MLAPTRRRIRQVGANWHAWKDGLHLYAGNAVACPCDRCPGAPRLECPQPGWRLRVSGSRAWRKSSASGSGGGNCVEVARAGAEVCVRDSKRRRGRIMTVAPAAWGSFLRALSDESFDGGKRS